MTLYWLGFAAFTAIVLALVDLPLPPVSPWTLAVWTLLVPATYLAPFSRGWLARWRLARARRRSLRRYSTA